MASTDRVCPFCGELPGAGVFCEVCGRNLAAIGRLPTREEWAAGASALPTEPAADPPREAREEAPARRPAEATTAFLAAMRAAGCPGTTKLQVPEAKDGFFRRTPEAHGWVVRPVAWDDRDFPRHYEPGLFLTPSGTYHRIDSQIRGWGQRDFPVFFDTAAAEALDPPADGRLAADLEAVLREHGVAPAEKPSRRHRSNCAEFPLLLRAH